MIRQVKFGSLISYWALVTMFICRGPRKCYTVGGAWNFNKIAFLCSDTCL